MRYEKKLEENKILIYKYDGDELVGYAIIYPLIEDPPLLEVDFYGADGLSETASERLEGFGVSSYEDLIKLPPDKLGLMIWGD